MARHSAGRVQRQSPHPSNQMQGVPADGLPLNDLPPNDLPPNDPPPNDLPPNDGTSPLS